MTFLLPLVTLATDLNVEACSRRNNSRQHLARHLVDENSASSLHSFLRNGQTDGR